MTGLQNNYANDSVTMQRRPQSPAGADSVQDHGCDRLFLHTRPVCCFFAILFAVQGLLLALQPQKNRSVLFGPGILKKRYMLICGNGILVYSFSTLTALLLDWIIGAAFHGMTGGFWRHSHYWHGSWSSLRLLRCIRWRLWQSC